MNYKLNNHYNLGKKLLPTMNVKPRSCYPNQHEVFHGIFQHKLFYNISKSSILDESFQSFLLDTLTIVAISQPRPLQIKIYINLPLNISTLLFHTKIRIHKCLFFFHFSLWIQITANSNSCIHIFVFHLRMHVVCSFFKICF